MNKFTYLALIGAISTHKIMFAEGMVGDEDLGMDITMKGEKYHIIQQQGKNAVAFAQAAAKAGSGVRARWVELKDCHQFNADGSEKNLADSGEIQLKDDLSNAIIATCKGYMPADADEVATRAADAATAQAAADADAAAAAAAQAAADATTAAEAAAAATAAAAAEAALPQDPTSIQVRLNAAANAAQNSPPPQGPAIYDPVWRSAKDATMPDHQHHVAGQPEGVVSYSGNPVGPRGHFHTEWGSYQSASSAWSENGTQGNGAPIGSRQISGPDFWPTNATNSYWTNPAIAKAAADAAAADATLVQLDFVDFAEQGKSNKWVELKDCTGGADEIQLADNLENATVANCKNRPAAPANPSAAQAAAALQAVSPQ